jgi:hypothetical protein
VSRDFEAKYDVERYRPLGLLANPFTITSGAKRIVGIDCETSSEANQLLGVLMTASAEEAPKPITVMKAKGIPAGYPLRAIGFVERSLATDDSVDVLHAYVQLFMMRLGRVRSIISVVAERLVFRDFDVTLSMYLSKVLTEPDTELASYQLIGEEGLAAFAARFSADPLGVTRELFGEEMVERHPELAEYGDSRADDLPSDVVDEDEAAPEVDSSMGDAPANAILLADALEAEEEDVDRPVVDYLVEYTQAHLSPVIARGLRVYRERGQVGLINELKVTKAPKKTLTALVRFARVRFKKVVLIFDGFDQWHGVPQDTRVQIVTSLSEVRWMLERDVIMTLMLEEGKVPEVEEQFGYGTRLTWAFDSLTKMQEDKDAIDAEVLDSWLSRAAVPGTTPMTMADPVLAEIAKGATVFADFAQQASAAIESAADRGVSALDDEALVEARSAALVEETE